MSNNWHIHCVQCDENSDFNLNCGEEHLEAIIEHRKAIEAMHVLACDPRIWDCAIETCGLRIYTDWFLKHQDHELVVQSEYGDIRPSEGSRLRDEVLHRLREQAKLQGVNYATIAADLKISCKQVADIARKWYSAWLR